ncbi:hypothetical protein ACIQUQ_03020 [Streptomyces sp. NPDC101118]|uniref:hypothetical protein n=1 Tax=Streptomyces sp. NPDC101118 TaxID=3366109 RepID=UPI00380F1776
MNDPRIPYAPEPEPAAEAEYSATVLGSHWFDGPVPDGHATTVREPRVPGGTDGDGDGDVTVPVPVPEVVPDRVEGSVLRFGPGVTAGAGQRSPGIGTTQVWHGGTLGGAPPPRPSRWAGLRRYTLAAVVLLAVLVYLGWQRYGPTVGVRSVAVQTAAEGPGCDSAADVVAVVRTDGRPGTLTYRWVRNDGSRSDVLEERVARGQREARLHLLWTFRGEGVYRARAELVLLTPEHRTAAGEFVYRCGG